MRFAYRLRGFGSLAPSPLRRHAAPCAYRGPASLSVPAGEAGFGHLQLVVADGRAWWDRAVAAGCRVLAPYERQFWGDDWGLLEDPFGIKWAVLQPAAQA